jgi:hypothetical protein
MSLTKADGTVSADRSSYVVSPMISLPSTDERNNGNIIPKEDSDRISTQLNKIEEGGVHPRRPIEYSRENDTNGAARGGNFNGGRSGGDREGEGGGDSPDATKIRSNSSDSAALDLIVQQLSLQHHAELSATSFYIKRDTLDESSSGYNNGFTESRTSMGRSSTLDHANNIPQSPRISIVFRNTTDRLESSASYAMQGRQSDLDCNSDSNSQRSVDIDIASKLVEAITGTGTGTGNASSRSSVRLTLSRTIPENQGMVGRSYVRIREDFFFLKNDS